MENIIVKYDTPVGQYQIDENFNVFLGFQQDWNYTSNNSLQDAIVYVESKIQTDLQIMKEGLSSQIDMLQRQRDALDLILDSSDYRIKL